MYVVFALLTLAGHELTSNAIGCFASKEAAVSYAKAYHGCVSFYADLHDYEWYAEGMPPL